MKKKILVGLVAGLLGIGILVSGCQQGEEVPDILKILSVSPELDATNVSSTESLSVTFNFSIDTRGMTKENVCTDYCQLISGSHTAGTPEVTKLAWSNENRTMTLNVIGWSKLGQGGDNNRVAIRATNRIKDIYGNTLGSEPVLWRYRLRLHDKAAEPTFVLASGSFEANSILVTIEAADADSIYYTDDGTDPTTSSNLYTAPISLESSKVIKALAVEAGKRNSDVATAWYDLYWWQALDSGANEEIRNIEIVGDDVYACGDFTAVSGVAANNLAKWNGFSWSVVGNSATDLDGRARALEYHDGKLYVGGSFDGAEAVANTAGIAVWDGSSWSALGTGLTEDPLLGTSVYGLAENNNKIYVGGRFASAGGLANTSCEAYWDGSNWNADAGDLDELVWAFVFDGTDIYMGGYFENAGGNANADRVARWTGSTWQALNTGLDSDVICLAMDSGGTLYAGGRFTGYLKKWNGSSWSTLGGGVDEAVRALMVSGDKLYVGGFFGSAGGVPNTKRIACWDITNSTWEAVGNGVTTTEAAGVGNEVHTIQLASDGSIYVGGDFAVIGDVTVNSIAKWGRK